VVDIWLRSTKPGSGSSSTRCLLVRPTRRDTQVTDGWYSAFSLPPPSNSLRATVRGAHNSAALASITERTAKSRAGIAPKGRRVRTAGVGPIDLR
jgi:hypothetical protein